MARKTFQLAKGVHVPGTKWLLVEEIARGGMGVTWRVVKKPGIHGVMKMILPDLAASSSYVRRFLEEVEILTKLNHPNIVQVFDFDTLEDGTPFFVMERLEGKTLGAAMVRTRNGARVRKAFPARVAYEITRQICEALYRAHSLQPRGVIHRDLKPENVYIHNPTFGAEPVIKLLDFGVAAFEQAARESGPVGTPRYMAPEQLRCEEITPKADLYAMGLVLYEMLVGRGPFDDLANAARPEDRALALANAHLHEAPPPPSRFAPWIPQSVDSWSSPRSTSRPTTGRSAPMRSARSCSSFSSSTTARRARSSMRTRPRPRWSGSPRTTTTMRRGASLRSRPAPAPTCRACRATRFARTSRPARGNSARSGWSCPSPRSRRRRRACTRPRTPRAKSIAARRRGSGTRSLSVAHRNTTPSRCRRALSDAPRRGRRPRQG